MAVRTLKRVNPKIWIPPEFTSVYKITVEDLDGNVDDITDDIIDCKVKDFVTESIGEFEFAIWNVNEEYTNKWTGGEIFRYYKDYATTATTLKFRGRLEKPSNRDNKLRVNGRSESLTTTETHITKSYDNIDTAVILKDMFDTFLPQFSTASIPATTGVTLTVTWSEKVFWEAVQEVCAASNYDCYIDPELVVQYFEKGSRNNMQEGIVHELNLIEVGDFAPDTSLVINKCRVYGSIIDGAQVLYTETSNDTTYGINSAIGVKELIVNDDTITTFAGAKDRAEFEISEGISPPIIGDVIAVNLLATINPGDNIRVSAPIDNLPINFYTTNGYEDKIEQDMLTTTITINKEPRIISHAMKKIIQNANDKEQTSSNPEAMDFSYNFTFDDDTGTHTNTEITDGVLKLQDGESSGTWISPARSLTSNLDEAYLRLVSDIQTGVTVSVSGNGGITYQTISDKELVDITNATGTSLVIKVVFSDATTQVKALNLLYKQE